MHQPLCETVDEDEEFLAIIIAWGVLASDPVRPLITQTEFDAKITGSTFIDTAHYQFIKSEKALRAAISVVGLGELWQPDPVPYDSLRPAHLYCTKIQILQKFASIIDSLPSDLAKAVRDKINGAPFILE